KTDYDTQRRILRVWFVGSGKCYEFEDVPPETFAGFRAAFAKGRYFNSYIRNRFRYRLVAAAGAPAAMPPIPAADPSSGNVRLSRQLSFQRENNVVSRPTSIRRRK
ncbi:MAG: KTSC domain-containing protein, partial [Mesorhizobium sp.]